MNERFIILEMGSHIFSESNGDEISKGIIIRSTKILFDEMENNDKNILQFAGPSFNMQIIIEVGSTILVTVAAGLITKWIWEKINGKENNIKIGSEIIESKETTLEFNEGEIYKAVIKQLKKEKTTQT